MHPNTIGALFFFTFSRNEDIMADVKEFFRLESVMEDWQECILPFAEGNVEEFAASISPILRRSGAKTESIAERVGAAVQDITDGLIGFAFGANSNAEEQGRSQEIVGSWMRGIPKAIVSSDLVLQRILLIPVRRLVEREFRDTRIRQGKLRQFYDDTGILSVWHRAHPLVWSDIAASYRLEYEIAEALHAEIESIQCESDGIPSLPIRNSINHLIKSLRDGEATHHVSIEDFARIFRSGLEDLYDLVDLELFIEAFPDELYLRNSDVKYKASFARKLALTAVKQWVHGHQMIKQKKEAVDRGSLPLKEDVIRACIHGHLNITSLEADRDCQYLFSYIRKQWLNSLLRSSSFHVYELFDHIDQDVSLANQMLCYYEDENDMETGSCLLTLSESLRCERRRKGFLDDPFTQMLMSYMQTGRRDHWSPGFGPITSNGFILPFSVNFDFDGTQPIDSLSYEVLVVDRLTQLEQVAHYLELSDISVITIDVFYKVFWSLRLERPVPNVVTIGTSKKVFVIIVGRMMLSMKTQEKSYVRDFFRILFERKSLLKVFSGTRQSEKAFALWTLVAEDPFRPTSVPDGLFMQPVLDFCDMLPEQRTFGEVVYTLLGKLIHCDFEETSDWSRADHQYLRESQLHFLASRSWLSLQLFHTLTFDNGPRMQQSLWAIDFNQAFGSGFFKEFREASSEQVIDWLFDNGRFLKEAYELVESSKEQLREDLYRAMFGEPPMDDTCTEYFSSERLGEELAFLS
jgi:hypothetical protein